MLTSTQIQIVYLMLLNGILFLGLNFIAYSLVFPGGRRSKRRGYLLIVSVVSALVITQELRVMLDLGFPAKPVRNVLLGGFALPVFLVSLVYYRIRKRREEASGGVSTGNSQDPS